MTVTAAEAFRSTLSGAAAPPSGLSLAAQALWWAGKGDWDRAHGCAQEGEGDPACDWVHAYLHRAEGDLANAGYWYRRAGRPVATAALQDEWEALVAALLRG
ncbi:MAG: hypothetical protein JO157_16570 [Acetobacteraceae bacterium]|nr:hypothetical protein [Acetobacteraceae bacterium]